MEKIAVNNLVVVLRGLLKTERVFLIKKMTSQIRKLQDSKGPDAEKRIQKAARWRDQVNYLKKVDLTTVARQALAAEEPWKNVLVRSDATPEQRALARLADRPRVQKVIEEFRSANADWKDWLPKVYDAWEKRKQKRFVVSGELEAPPLNETEEECQNSILPEGRNTARMPMKSKAAFKGVKVISSGTSKPEVKKTVLQKAGEKTAKETSVTQSSGVPVQSPDRVQKLFMKMAAEEEPDEELPPRKFAAGDPFFWPAGKTGSDDDEDGARRPPFNPSKKQRLPPPQRGLGETAGKRQHSAVFSHPSAKSGPPQAFRKAPPSTGNQPSSESSANLHPSWAAKRQAQKAVVPFQGKKITFS
uniref:Serum response factor-binding protein 1 n=1 Tax=Rhipicephalus appendiculatus TaxID=34631 RepID=A0A131YFX8_RHIAP